jgi:hypothetical protein
VSTVEQRLEDVEAIRTLDAPAATLTRETARRDAGYGLETMCIGGGQGLAALFERA